MTREEAIKVASETYGWLKTDREREALETLIPELAESEDERIRKWIIDELKDSLHEIEAMYSRDYDIRAGRDKERQAYLNKAIAYLENQKEQNPEEKPINWTELTWKDIIELEGIINKVHYEFRNGIGQESFGKEVLEKFREYKGDEYLDEIEQKPAGWSEEDEK